MTDRLNPVPEGRTHEHGKAGSNNRNALLTFAGCIVKGVLIGTLAGHRGDFSQGSKTLVFECGWGLTFNSIGAYYPTNPETIQATIRDMQSKYRETAGQLEELLAMAGAT